MNIIAWVIVFIGMIAVFGFFSNPEFYRRCISCTANYFSHCHNRFSITVEKRRQRILSTAVNTIVALLFGVSVAASVVTHDVSPLNFNGHPNQHSFPVKMFVDVGNKSGDCTQCHMILGQAEFRKDHKKAIGKDGRYKLGEGSWCHEGDEG